MILCSYGCGGVAKHVIGKAKKPCCNTHFTKCPAYRERASMRQTGQQNTFYGRKHTAETRANMHETRKGDGNSFFGKHHTDTTISQISMARKGTCTGENNHNFGKRRSEDTRKKISTTRCETGVAAGKRNPRWRGGASKRRNGVMQTTKYKEWRRNVLLRDNATCQMCGAERGPIVAHHIIPWSVCHERRYDISNGMALCRSCHIKTYSKQ